MTTIKGTIGNDSNGSNPNLPSGTAGDDLFITSTGHDYLLASAGNDSYHLGYSKNATQWRYGGPNNDFDTLDYSNAWSSFLLPNAGSLRIVADLELGTIQKVNVASSIVLATDTVISLDSLVGTAGNDTLLGRNSWGYEEFHGLGGNDLINGRGGEDAANYFLYSPTHGITVNLAAGTVISADANIGTDTLREIEDVVGTLLGDTYNAAGYGGASVNRNSWGEEWNIFRPMGGNDVITGNGQTVAHYGGVGGAITINLGGQTAPGVKVKIVTAFTDNPLNTDYNPGGNVQGSGIYGAYGGDYNDTLIGGGRVNTAGAIAANTLSGDESYEIFRGHGGDDFIDGKTGLDRADYRGLNQTDGIVVNLAAGTVIGDPLITGTDTLRGIEVIRGTYVDDVYDATGFTLSNAVAASINSGDIVVNPPAGVTLGSDAFNMFQALAGNDTVIGNGATRVSFNSILVENLTGSVPTVRAIFSNSDSGSADYGLTDGGYGTVSFSGVYSVRGSEGHDELRGSTGYQHLIGYYGNDSLFGGDGADVLFGFDGGSTAALNLTTIYTDNDWLDGGADNDLLRGDFGNDTLVGGTGDDTMEGGTGNDSLDGGAGNDALDGGSGNDSLLGGDGNDTVSYLSATSGVIVSLALAGAQATGGSGSDMLTSIEHLTGSNNADKLTGNAGANRLEGGSGNDTLDGGSGNDTMLGGDGNDLYYVRDTGDVVTETNANLASGGTDLVYSYLPLALGSYFLGDNVENGRIVTTAASDLTGNGLANVLYAGQGNNFLNGGGGSDTVSYFYAISGVNVSLALAGGQATVGSGTDTLTSIEHLTGSNFADTLLGSGGANKINGGTGNDHLAGGLGNDTLTGGIGIDTFRFDTLPNAASNRDTISDFSVVDDTIELENAIFTALTSTGMLATGSFHIGIAAGDADDRVIYNSGTGALLYDSDGTGTNAAVQFASVASGLVLTSADFFVA